jgi:hypothetical protein
MESAAKIATLKQGLRIKYAGNPTGLRALWAKVFDESAEFVEITGNAYEGGSASGNHILHRLEYLAAVQDILAEIDPAGTPSAPPPGTFADFRAFWVQT